LNFIFITIKILRESRFVNIEKDTKVLQVKEKSMKDSEKNSKHSIENKEYSSVNRNNFIPFNNIPHLIRNLSNPKFLGSIHLKKEMNPNYNQVKDLLASEHEVNLTRSLKNTIFNPITKILIFIVILFNIFWFLAIYVF
jgi:hypothetical protein